MHRNAVVKKCCSKEMLSHRNAVVMNSNPFDGIWDEAGLSELQDLG